MLILTKIIKREILNLSLFNNLRNKKISFKMNPFKINNKDLMVDIIRFNNRQLEKRFPLLSQVIIKIRISNNRLEMKLLFKDKFLLKTKFSRKLCKKLI